MSNRGPKPLGAKAYGHIPHLPNSRMGPGDHHCHNGQAQICTEKARDKHDVIHVQEKLDGSCVSVAKIDGQIVPLVRAGYTAISSPYPQHALFAQWAYANTERFALVLGEGERVVGEWLAQAHGTRYALPHEPFVAFDLMTGAKRATLAEAQARLRDSGADFVMPHLLHSGGPLSVEKACAMLDPLVHGAQDPIEGVMYRVERKGEVDFLAKWVRPDKKDGCFLPDVTGLDAVWNWRPE